MTARAVAAGSGRRRMEGDRRARRGAGRLHAGHVAGGTTPGELGGCARRGPPPPPANMTIPRRWTTGCWRARRCPRGCCPWWPRRPGMLDSGPRALTWAELLLSGRSDVAQRAGGGGAHLRARGAPRRHGADADEAGVLTRRIARRGSRVAPSCGNGLGRTRQESARSGCARRAGGMTPKIRCGGAAIACARRDPGAADWREGDPRLCPRRARARSGATPVAAELDGRPAARGDGGGAGAEGRGRGHRRQVQLMQVLGEAMSGAAALSGRWHGAGGRASVPAVRGRGGVRRGISRRVRRRRFARMASVENPAAYGKPLACPQCAAPLVAWKLTESAGRDVPLRIL